MNDHDDIWAVIPIKGFDDAKQRLSGAHPPAFRRQLAMTMAEDVLSAAVATPAITGVLVVTDDADAAALARRYGARVTDACADQGQTAAVTAAARLLADEGIATVLTLPTDIPGITVAELTQLTGLHRGHAYTIVPAHDERGSNAILCSPPTRVPFAFGNDSFAPHVASARALGIDPQIVPLERIGLDVDNPKDLAAFAAKNWPTRTTEFLHNAVEWQAHAMALGI